MPTKSELGNAAEAAPYYPHINALRLIAVSIVLAEHWLHPILMRTGIDGSYGVWLFFVISGYLITSILMSYATSVQSGENSTFSALKVFYGRRFLRIFPAYYTLLLFAWFAGRLTEANAAWHLAYLSNFYFIHVDRLETLGHLWSLAVEEQFYLFWPIMVLLIPNRLLGYVISAGIISGLVFRLFTLAANKTLIAYVAPIACFDTLGIGALLSWLLHARNQPPPVGRIKLRIMIERAGLAALIALPALILLGPRAKALVAPAFIALAGFYLVSRSLDGFKGPLGRLAMNPLVQYLGKISYGLYLYQSLAAWLIPEDIGGMTGTRGLIFSAALRAMVLIGIASISWRCIETPANLAKRYFQIRPRETAGLRT